MVILGLKKKKKTLEKTMSSCSCKDNSDAPVKKKNKK